MWFIADTTQGFFLEYWLNEPMRKCVVSMKADCDLVSLEALMTMLRACGVTPR